MYDRKCYVDIRLLGCALVLLVMALLTIHTGLDKKAVTAAADPAPAAVVSTQDTRLSEDAGSVRYGCVHVENYPSFKNERKNRLTFTRKNAYNGDNQSVNRCNRRRCLYAQCFLR